MYAAFSSKWRYSSRDVQRDRQKDMQRVKEVESLFKKHLKEGRDEQRESSCEGQAVYIHQTDGDFFSVEAACPSRGDTTARFPSCSVGLRDSSSLLPSFLPAGHSRVYLRRRLMMSMST